MITTDLINAAYPDEPSQRQAIKAFCRENSYSESSVYRWKDDPPAVVFNLLQQKILDLTNKSRCHHTNGR